MKLGRFLFVEHAEFFRDHGVREVVVAPRSREFSSYLLKVGFEPAIHRQGIFQIRYAGATD